MSNQVLENIQSNENKAKVRKLLQEQMVTFAKITNQDINLVSLPSTHWEFEKGLAQQCKDAGIKLSVTGLENTPIPSTYLQFHQNAPDGMSAIRGDINEYLSHGTHNEFVRLGKGVIDENVIYPDLCGFAVKYIREGRYAYPTLNNLAHALAYATTPKLVYATFRCTMSRFEGGEDAVLKKMGGVNCGSMRSAIRHKMGQIIADIHYKHHCRTHIDVPIAKKVFEVYYNGTGRSKMLTIGWAVGFDTDNPMFSRVKQDWVKTEQKQKEVAMKNMKKQKRVIVTEWTSYDVQKNAIKVLNDAGWRSNRIGVALGISKHKVAGVLAWHNHRGSWQD